MNAGKLRESGHLYEFGVFRLDPQERTFARNGKRIPLAPKAFDTLLILVQNSGRVLTKERLIQALWPDSFVEENNLTQHISALRRALGDDPGEYIETVPKLGYRFVCPVREIAGDGSVPLEAGDAEVVITRRTRTHIVLREEIEEEETDDAPPATAEVTTAQKPQRKTALRNWILIPAAAAVVALGGATILLHHRPPAPTPSPAPSLDAHAVAVLPLRNLKPDPKSDFLGMALADAIISRLGYVSEISAEPLSSVARYQNAGADPRQVARDLKVQNVLLGSYLVDGDDVRVTLDLIDGSDGSVRWRDNIETRYDKLLAVQDRVAGSVFHAMGVELQPDEVERLRRDAPTNAAAYEYYLRGIDAGFHSDYKTAAQLLQKSVALEPGNAMAWCELATVYIGYAGIEGGGPAYLDKGWQAFHRAIALDPDNRFVVDVMAFQLIEHHRGEEAVPLLQGSLRYNPTDSFAHYYLSEAYRYGGALEQSISEGERALELNPRVGENMTMTVYLYAGQYGRFLQSLPLDEQNPRTVFYRGLAYYYLRDQQKAAQEFDRAYALSPVLLHAQIGHAFNCAMRSNNAEGLKAMSAVESSGTDDGEMLYKMAQAYAQLGDRDSALRLLRKSIEMNFYPYTYFAGDPLLAPIRQDPRYTDLMQLAQQRQERFRDNVLRAGM